MAKKKFLKKEWKNPFKMWGSYIGAVLGWLSLMVFGIDYYNFFYLTIWQNMLNLSSVSWAAIPQVVILGFLVGWLVEITLRKKKVFGLK